MAKLTKTVHVDLASGKHDVDTLKMLVRTYGGRCDNSFSGFVCARVPRTRLSHFKGTTTRMGIDLTIND